MDHFPNFRGENNKLVGGFNPVQKYQTKWESSPSFGVRLKKCLKPPPSLTFKLCGGTAKAVRFSVFSMAGQQPTEIMAFFLGFINHLVSLGGYVGAGGYIG